MINVQVCWNLGVSSLQSMLKKVYLWMETIVLVSAVQL